MLDNTFLVFTLMNIMRLSRTPKMIFKLRKSKILSSLTVLERMPCQQIQQTNPKYWSWEVNYLGKFKFYLGRFKTLFRASVGILEIPTCILNLGTSIWISIGNFLSILNLTNHVKPIFKTKNGLYQVYLSFKPILDISSILHQYPMEFNHSFN